MNKTINNIQKFWHTEKDIIPTLSVRTAFDLLLQSLQLPPGSEVLMSAINIADMVEIVERHQLVPVPVDIDLLTCEPSIPLLEKLVSQKTKILLIAHIFGTIIDLNPYVDFCRQKNLILIEDCAQGFAGNRYYGHWEADVSFFSFGPIKSCTALGGAITLLKDKNLSIQMQEIEATYPQKSETWFFIRILKFMSLKILSFPWIYCQLLSLLKLCGQDLDSTIVAMTRGFAQGDLFIKIRHRPPQHLLWLLSDRLSQCGEFLQRQKTGENFQKILPKNILVPGVKASLHSFWLFPIIVNHPHRVLQYLRTHNFDASRGSTSLIVKESHDQQNHLAPENAKYLMQQILFLPVYPDVPVAELTRLSQCLRDIIENPN
ncbi:DegT/DnrJ/EryC1/StrS family aminotransferase [Calothrix sp. 336/3]|uniref:DegT/DnrJ/EryC1/StrS family aminotransferase n=1 Tax=Calothrix sp. 336/3 TaxID=1337936 RepID=UPI000B0BF107|nr:DegT/DnrJ/EryC1/StrS family aminotransferase [Calothrix sp. 336/3]